MSDGDGQGGAVMIDYLYRIVPMYKTWGGVVMGLHELTDYEALRGVWHCTTIRYREVCHATMLEF